MALPEEHLDGKYEIVGKIKEGGMGAVYKVRHRFLDELRVIKIIRPSLEPTRELSERFLREARTAIQLRHPNIATLYDFAVGAGGSAFIVMEFIDGQTLGELLADRDPPALGLGLEIACQALRAIRFLHQHGVVHRDIAPDNLMLTRGLEGEPLVKLIDLGIAKILGGEGELTSTGLFLGKPRYASPEHFGGEAGLDARSDLYSFSVVLYELLTGRSPIEGHDPSSYMAGHLIRPARDFSITDPEGRVPSELRAVLLAGLAKKPADRIQSAAEFALRLAPFQLDHPVRPGNLDRALAPAAQAPRQTAAGRPGSTQALLDREFGIGSTPAPVAALDGVTARLPAGGGRPPERRPDLVAPTGGPAAESGRRGWNAPQDPARGQPGRDVESGRSGWDGLVLARTEAPAEEAPSPHDDRRPAPLAGPAQPRGRLLAWLAVAGVAALGGALSALWWSAHGGPAQRAAVFASRPGPGRRGVGSGLAAGRGAEPPAAATAAAGEPAPPAPVTAPAGSGNGLSASGGSPGAGSKSPATAASGRVPVSQERSPGGSAGAASPAPQASPQAGAARGKPPSSGSPGSEKSSGTHPPLRPPVVPDPAEADPDLIRPGPGVEMPEPGAVPDAVYPQAASGSGLEAHVLVGVLVGEHGEVLRTRIKSGDASGLGFNEAALEAARRARFLPATRGGVPGKAWSELMFDFIGSPPATPRSPSHPSGGEGRLAGYGQPTLLGSRGRHRPALDPRSFLHLPPATASSPSLIYLEPPGSNPALISSRSPGPRAPCAASQALSAAGSAAQGRGSARR